MAGERAIVYAAADRGAVVLPFLCHLQWRDGRFPTEIMPIEVRTSGFSLAYSLATAIFGGFTPAICTYLIHVTGNRAVPGLWLSFAAICGLSAALALSPKQLHTAYRELISCTMGGDLVVPGFAVRIFTALLGGRAPDGATEPSRRNIGYDRG